LPVRHCLRGSGCRRRSRRRISRARSARERNDHHRDPRCKPVGQVVLSASVPQRCSSRRPPAAVVFPCEDV
jgi:hypothetical protein